jgi:DNA-binding response OmpR family regulator
MPIVLVVDDSPVVRRVLARRLSGAGFDVREHDSAAPARDADTTSLACAVLDLDLPDGDGADLAVGLRARHASLPVAFFTAASGGPVVERARSLGPVFLKPDVYALLQWVMRSTSPDYPPPTK